MSAVLEGTPDKRLALVTGRAYPEQAEETAHYLGTEVLPTTAYDFANGEMYVRALRVHSGGYTGTVARVLRLHPQSV